jgi:protein-export membrane protein SecD
MWFLSMRKVAAALLAAFFAGAGLSAAIGQTAKIEFRMVDFSVSVEQALQTRPPAESEILYGIGDKQPYLVEKQVRLSAADMCNAQPGFDQRSNEPIVSFRFNSNGARRFAQVTTENVGRTFAIVIDNEVAAAPVIREPILGGSGQISGKFTVERANELANQIRANAVTKC